MKKLCVEHVVMKFVFMTWGYTLQKLAQEAFVDQQAESFFYRID